MTEVNPSVGRRTALIVPRLRAEHPVGHRSQVGAMVLEALGEPFLVVRRSRPLDSRCVTGMTPPA